jgi:hypothetical protein
MKAHVFGCRANAPKSQKAKNSKDVLNLIGLLAVSFLFIVSLATASAQTLTVNDGSGGGPHVAGEQFTVTADEPPPHEVFTGWSGDTQILANPSLPTTTATMPSIDVTISATYAETADRQTSIATATASPSPSPTASPSPSPTASPSPSPTASPSPSPTPGGTCHITVTVLGITRRHLVDGKDVGDEWSFRFHTFVDEVERSVDRIPAVGTTKIPDFRNAAGPGPFVLFSNLLPKASSYNIRVFVVAHEDDTPDPTTTPPGELTGLPSLPGDDRGLQNFEFGELPCPSDNRELLRTIDVAARRGGDADEANERGAIDRIRIRFRITLVDP